MLLHDSHESIHHIETLVYDIHHQYPSSVTVKEGAEDGVIDSYNGRYGPLPVC
jgi:hypothetical protein